MPLGKVFRHPAAGAVGHDRAFPLPQHVIDAHGQRILLAHVAARLVDHRQAVGVGVLAEADVGRRLGDGLQHAGQVLGRRLGRDGRTGRRAPSPSTVTRQASSWSSRRPKMLPAPWFESKTTRNRHLRIRSASTVSSTASRCGDDRLLAALVRAELVVRQPGGRAGAILPQDLFAGPGRNHPAVGGKQFQPVVGRRIVAGGDLDAAAGAPVTHAARRAVGVATMPASMVSRPTACSPA